MMNLVALAAVFVEQTAVDNGRLQLSWLLTGLNQPAFNLTSQHTQRTSEEPFARLADPRWIAANLAYLKDLDFFEQRQKSTPAPPGAPSTEDPARRRRPRGKPKTKATPG